MVDCLLIFFDLGDFVRDTVIFRYVKRNLIRLWIGLKSDEFGKISDLSLEPLDSPQSIPPERVHDSTLSLPSVSRASSLTDGVTT